MTVWPSISWSLGCTRRATRSVVAPGPKPTTMCSGLPRGQSCAATGKTHAKASRKRILTMLSSTLDRAVDATIPRMWRAVLLVFSLGISQWATAQEGAIRIVLGFPVGTSSDLLARLLADQMRVSLGQPVMVENRTGAGGQLANETVKAAAPDGATLLIASTATMSIDPHAYRNLRYD